MSARLPETCLAFLIAGAFALLGDLLLGRRSTRLSSWTESFLIGAGVGASALFPLSLLAPRRALDLLAALLGVAAAAGLALRLTSRSRAPQAPPRVAAAREPWDIFSLAFASLTAGAALVFLALNWRYSYLWDGFQIWAARAQVLFHQRDLVPELTPGDYFNRALAYPPLIPAIEALVALLRGGFDFEALKPVFAVFYLAMVAATYRAARVFAPRSVAFAATALLCLLPWVSTRGAAGGYADMPQSAYVAAVVAAFLASENTRDWRSPAAWLIGSLAAVKEEGVVLAVIALLVAGAVFLLRRRRELRSALRSAVSFLGPPALLLGLRFAYVRWVAVGDTTYGPLDRMHIVRGAARIPEVLRLAAKQMFSIHDWGLFWAAFLLAAIVLFFRGSWKLQAVAGGTLLAIAAYTSVFLFTSWSVPLHIAQAYPRLLAQLAPAAAVVIVAGFRELRGSATGKSESAGVAAA